MSVLRTLAVVTVYAALCNGVSARNGEHEEQRWHTRMAGPYLLDMRIDRGVIFIEVNDRAGRPIDTAGGKGKAVVHTDGRAVTVGLYPSPPNLLSGRGRYRLNRATVVYVTVDLKKERAHPVVFRPLSPMPAPP